MATDKRERQRLNRAAKQDEDKKAARKQKTFDTAKRIAVWAIVGGLLLVVANIVWG